MKLTRCLSVCLLLLTANSFGQTPETFDIATFHVPTGWQKKVTADTVQLSSNKAEAFCLITVYKSVPALGGPDENFEASWKTIVASAVNVPAASQMSAPETKAGWEIRSGLGEFDKQGVKGIVYLVNASAFGKMVNVILITNSADYEKDISEFLNSISLKKPEPSVTEQSSAGQQAAGGTDVTAVVGTWGAASSNQSSYAVSNGLGGYIKKQYTFSPNGTYEFLVKTFQYTMRNLLFTKETGTYQLNGNSLTLIPQKGYIQAWTKGSVVDSTGRRSETDNWGKLVSTQPTKLEKVTYQISKQYFSGIQEWQLVMQAGKPTERDGPFTANAAFPNSWLYGTQKFPIVPPQ